MRESQVVVILGASSGIGRATALSFAREGAALILAARSAPALETVAQECHRLGAEALAVPTDATDADAVRALAEQAITRHGRIDVWFNNVGTGAVGRFDETPIEAHRRVVEANLLGGIHGAHAVLPHFRRQKRGTLIQMISVGGWTPIAYAVAYTASKFGLRGFVEALRAELADLPDVHVCAVYPTIVDTPGLSHGANYSGKQLLPGGPILDPREVAENIVALARRPRPSLVMGAGAMSSRWGHGVAPDFTAAMLRRVLDRNLKKAPPASASSGNLFEPSVGHAIEGGARRSQASWKGPMAAIALGGLGLAFLASKRRSAR